MSDIDAKGEYESIDDYNIAGLFGDNGDGGGKNMKGKTIETTSQVELPFSAEVAFNLY